MSNDNLWFQRDQPEPEIAPLETTEPTKMPPLFLPDRDELKEWFKFPFFLIASVFSREYVPKTTSNPTLRRP